MKFWLLLLTLLLPAMAQAGDTALSHDGKWLAIANHAPHQLAIQSVETGRIVKVFDMIGRDGIVSNIEGVYTDAKRRLFLVTLRDVAEYWLVATDPNAPPVYEGFVHSREAGMIEGLPSSEGLFSRRRVILEQPIARLTFSEDMREMTAVTADGLWLVTYNLNVNRQISIHPYDVGTEQ